jgi:hypothetical protein
LKVPERPVLEDAHGPDALAEDRCDRLDVEVAEHPEHHDLCLRGREPPDEPLDGLLAAHALESRLGGARDRINTLVELRRYGQAPTASLMVDETPPRDGEHQGFQLDQPALEPGQDGCEVHPHVGGDVLRFVAQLMAQVSNQTRIEIAVEGTERVVIAPAGGGYGPLEIIVTGRIDAQTLLIGSSKRTASRPAGMPDSA